MYVPIWKKVSKILMTENTEFLSYVYELNTFYIKL